MRDVHIRHQLFVLAAVVLAVGLLLASSPPASAELNTAPDEVTVLTNGRVNAVLAMGDKIYLGGNFHQVGPNTGYGVALSPNDGKRDLTFPRVNGNVFAAVADGNGGWYIGGDFSKVGSSERSRLAHILADGQVANWNPGANNTVRALALSKDGSRLYVGGAFTSVGGTTRNRLAVIDAATGALDPTWDPSADNDVNALALSTDGSRLYVGGAFTSVSGATRSRLAAVDTGNGTVDVSFAPDADDAVNTLALSKDGSRLFVGGAFTSVGGVSRSRLAAIDAATRELDPAWNPGADGAVNALAFSADGSRLFAGGAFTSVGGTARSRLAAVDASTGAVDSGWTADATGAVNALALSADGSRLFAGGAFTRVGGTGRNRLAAVDAATGATRAWNPNANNVVYALSVGGARVYTGGAFSSVNGVSRDRLAAVDASTGQLTNWAPRASAEVRALAASPDGSRIYVGGGFRSVSGVKGLGRLAAIDAATGAVDPAWKPQADSAVRALATSGDRVYFGGDFLTVNGQARKRLAAVDAISGELDPDWHPVANGRVRTLLPSSDGKSVYAGGDFTDINGRTRPYLALLNSAVGNVRAWRPAIDPNGTVWDLEVSGERLYTGEGGPGGAIAAYDMGTGARIWRHWANGDAQAIALLGEKVYVGGHFDTIGGDLGVYEGRVPRNAFAAFDAATGTMDQRWAPSESDGQVWALEPDAARMRIYAGGEFTSISGQPHQGFAQFSERTPPAEGT